MDETPVLDSNRHWRMAVWALRVGYVGLVVVIIGLIVDLAGSTPWVLAAGMVIWLAAAGVTTVGFLWGRSDLPEPHPGFWTIRSMLIRDTLHARPYETH